jgi:small basic protein
VGRKLITIVLLIALCLLAFLIVNATHFLFLPVRVVLYDALLDAVVAIVVVAALLFALARQKLPTSAMETGLALSIGFLIAVIFAILVPTVIDRSLSVYILEKLDQRGGGIKQEALEGVLKQEYFVEQRLVDIRLTEQLNSGTVTIASGCIKLTPWGKAIVRFTEFYRKTLLPKKREIMGTFTDDLTDPFRHSSPVASYTCH